MKEAVLEGDEELSVRLAEKALEDGMDLQKVMNEGFLAGIREAGRLYENEEYFLPDLVCSADAIKRALAVLDEALKQDGSAMAGTGVKIALATVQGDVHDIGKTIVGAMMTASGFEVCDIGTDVANEDVVDRVRKLKPDVVGLSALLTTTMEEQGNIIEMLKAEGMRDSVRVIIGGAPVNQDWADRIGADGYSENAIEAVSLVKGLLDQEKN